MRCKYQEPDWGKIQLRQRRNVNLRAWVGLRWDLDWGEMHILRRVFGDILKPVWVWDDAWMELRCNLVDLDGGDVLPGCRRDANIRSQIEVRFNWDKEETWIWEPERRPGLSWAAHLETGIGWYGTRMELRYNSAVEKWPGWNWDNNYRYMLHRCHSIQWVNLTKWNWSDSKIFIEYICGKHHWFLYYIFASLNIYTSLCNPCTLNNIKQ